MRVRILIKDGIWHELRLLGFGLGVKDWCKVRIEGRVDQMSLAHRPSSLAPCLNSAANPPSSVACYFSISPLLSFRVQADLLGEFRSPGPALLIVCSKFETGFDEPRVCCVVIDRTLRGAHAVQARLEQICDACMTLTLT